MFPNLIESRILYYHFLPKWKEEAKFRQRYFNKPFFGLRERPNKRIAYVEFGYFWADNLNTHNLTGARAMSAIAEAWNSLPKHEKNQWSERVKVINIKEKEMFARVFPDKEWSKQYVKDHNSI